MILIGSRAIALQAPNFLGRKPVDFDFVASENEAVEWLDSNHRNVTERLPGKLISFGTPPVEFDLIEPGSSNELLADLVKDVPETPFGKVPNMDLLFTIKSAHKYKRNSPHFWKTLSDYHRLKRAGAKIRPEYEQFHKLREKETYTYTHPNLKQGKREFFTDNVKYVYDHDSIHRAVALGKRPAYLEFAREGEEVFSSKTKFYQQTTETQLNSVIEEAAVLAVERSLVPFPGVLSEKDAWVFALSKICSSIASGWWRAFAYENALTILKMYPEGYYSKFQQGLAQGIVKLA